MRCEQCGREIPEGHYCAYCGAHLARNAAGHNARRRRQVFAANPSEHVYHPSVISTLFPHLGPSRTHTVRWVLAGAALVVFLIAFGRYVPLALVLAALLVPALYLFYFYDVAIYKDEPLIVLATTFVAGLVLGTLLSLVLYKPILDQVSTSLLPGNGPSQGYVVLTAIVLPVLALALMLVGPVILLVTRRKFDEVLDGLAFAAASGLGFAAAQSIVFSWILITGRFQQAGAGYSWALDIIRVALLQPLLYAAAAGLAGASLWLARDHQVPRQALGPIASPPVAVGAALLGMIVPALLSVLYGGQVLDLLYYGVTLVCLLLIVRHVLHVGLIEKARALGHGGPMRCPHCYHEVGDTPFCPHCGLAMRSVSQRQRPQARPVPPAEQV
ncbi:MAG: PrsW family glutamic-type intramembrane protease [Ktedonobacterales bacterium]|jgi:RsiW-degrading membrane proteinase PrsW (M82 family)